MTLTYLCVHGHFYQPPREDPITGKIPNEIGAAPYHNWNERIHAECYRPNAKLGNFERISFNIGPTLSEWMIEYDPDTFRLIVDQDRANVKRNGVGNAIAQAYNHTILPLATRADKITQVSWGIADFEHNFGRKPQGMWLPESAVDLETLCVLADQGIEFTILAPWQAEGGQPDPTEPYRVALPNDKSITVFFYHAELSTLVSFDPAATVNADAFVTQAVIPRYRLEKSDHEQSQMLLIASDGELYGHHKQFRDHFLAYLLDSACQKAGISPTYPGFWMKEHPPRKTIGIREDTSWSCHHGVIRWMGACSCTPGDGVWKAYLRRAFDRLGDVLDDLYIEAVTPYIPHAWTLRDRYIHVLLGEITAQDLINQSAGHALPSVAVHRIRLLLEAQRERQRMFTSCGWYFDDFGRIESKNNVAYAAQAVRLVRLATGVDLAPRFSADLKHVISHHTGARGDLIFQWQMQRAEELTRPLPRHLAVGI
jgi:hypothetical protein